MDGDVSGPKKLGVFGASYLYPVLMRFGVIKSVEKASPQKKSPLPIQTGDNHS